MDRKVLMPIIALIFFAIMIVSPVMAITKASYWEHVEGAATGAPAKAWQANGIMIIEGLPWEGSYEGTLGTGTMEVCYEHMTVNTETGKGTVFATWTIVIGGNTLSGSANGKITGGRNRRPRG